MRFSKKNINFLIFAKKYNAFSLLKSYFKNRILVYSLIQLMILPKDKTGLELFRKCIEKKLYNRLRKKNENVLSDYEMVKRGFSPIPAPKIIWLCWFQGFENAPELVKSCRNSIYKHCRDFKIIEITSQNFYDYVDIPEFIIVKWKKGVISNTHFSDILRIYLLDKHGGYWIDSTVLVTGEIPDDIKASSFFVFQSLKPGRDGTSVFVSSWFMLGCKNHPIIKLTKILLENYWRKNNSLCDYFLLHYFVCFSCEKLNEYYEQMPCYSNSTPHILFFHLEKRFDLEIYNSICNQTPVHKLSYKGYEGYPTEDNFLKFILEIYN